MEPVVLMLLNIWVEWDKQFNQRTAHSTCKAIPCFSLNRKPGINWIWQWAIIALLKVSVHFYCFMVKEWPQGLCKDRSTFILVTKQWNEDTLCIQRSRYCYNMARYDTAILERSKTKVIQHHLGHVVHFLLLWINFNTFSILVLTWKYLTS